MSFFGNNENIERLKKNNTQTNKVLELLKNTRLATLGDFILFDKVIKNFIIYKENIDLPESNDYIPIGVVLSLDSHTLKAQVLIKSFLLDAPLRIPFSYLGKENLIPVYIKQLYERYIRGFIKQCPNYKKLKKMKLKIITIDLLLSFMSYGPMYTNFKKLIGEEKTKKFFQKIDDNGIYVIDRGKLRIWEKPSKELDDGIEDVSIRGGNFLTVVEIQL